MLKMEAHLDQPQFGEEAFVSSGQQDGGEVHGFEEHRGEAGLKLQSTVAIPCGPQAEHTHVT